MSGHSKYLDKTTQGSIDNLAKYFELGKEAIDWYHDAKEFCRELEHIHGVRVDVIAAVTAVLSPAIRWDYNMTATKLYIEAFTTGQSQPVIGGYGRNRDKAWKILRTGDVTLVSGQKVTSFYRNILGFHQDVTIDRQAIKAWLGLEQGFNGKGYQFPKSVYDNCANDYRKLAQIHNLTPAQVQAAVWIGYRSIKKDNRGVSNE